MSNQDAQAAQRLAETGLVLFRQLVSGSNALRDLDVFSCNFAEHNDGCECFWEQCEAWAKADAALVDTARPTEDTQATAHRLIQEFGGLDTMGELRTEIARSLSIAHANGVRQGAESEREAHRKMNYRSILDAIK